MSVSSIFGSPILLLPRSSSKPVNPLVQSPPKNIGYGGGLAIECSSRPTKKATAHHRKTRPRKSQPWDIKRGPTVYPPLPPLPAEWTLISSSASDDGTGDVTQASSTSAAVLEAPVSSE
ncbi:50S ribosomal protein 6, chloroplastic [Mercurialis annua]|uniref:50S ribosomal protein 6, chloroplastic n=1 Tax=Mercurialis annua TaxID=3986 RepID=UPI00215E5BF4|nr:50S ribosomal protein 6, chloroplastic [Mercurialis annua]